MTGTIATRDDVRPVRQLDALAHFGSSPLERAAAAEAAAPPAHDQRKYGARTPSGRTVHQNPDSFSFLTRILTTFSWGSVTVSRIPSSRAGRAVPCECRENGILNLSTASSNGNLLLGFHLRSRAHPAKPIRNKRDHFAASVPIRYRVWRAFCWHGDTGQESRRSHGSDCFRQPTSR
jgi:hypothetical protein